MKTDIQIVAEFDGWIPFKYKNKVYAELQPYKKEGVFGDRFEKDFKYKEYWDWLMPVWYKFKNLEYPKDSIQWKQHDYRVTAIGNSILFDGIKEACRELTESIKWHNAQNPKP